MAASLNMLLIAVAGLGAIAIGVGRSPSLPDRTELTTIPAGTFAYRAAGEYLRNEVPVNAPRLTVAFGNPLVIMQRQVSAAEYRRCVDDGACKAADAAIGGGADNLPVVGVNWYDAVDYAAWLSRATGHSYRLPTDAEWAYAAGTRFADDTVAVEGDRADPAKRWLAAYESESAATPLDPKPLPFGSFGTDARGLADLAGNVWEWTSSCYVRSAERDGAPGTRVENCGVRVVEGRHRTYMSDFVREPRGGACSVGAPPSNLGIRLVRDDGPLTNLIAMARRIALPGG
jgi:formylglycine-generating enzyme required for sulfatase activity